MSDYKLTENINKKNGIANLKIQGNLTIENSDSIKKKLIEIYNNSNELNITLTNIEKIDFAIIQLFYSLIKTDKKSNKKIILNTNFSEKTNELLKNSGLNNVFNNKNNNFL